ncbi:NUDIX domain-containing protein [Haloactinopolyspora alba]|uniref:NUDIX domain-containing protein n=1 Tax=Haloactinopolyspora alba TaxID=648780 RepID=A0A2P8E7C2_9ACTN|nr:CoA pyrophosphatase [Haloactinopolyspora alba]PSL05373.1 NUDIX domain-containing protein [Haloactinopolyspora alba]
MTVANSVPAWLRPLAEAAQQVRSGELSRFAPPDDGSARPCAVLLLFGESDGEPDVLLTERAAGLRRHAGQAAFPGGVVDPEDSGPVQAALREGAEETGLDPAGVDVLATAPPLWIPVTNYAVTPVLGWWRVPTEVRVVDEAEVAAVHRVPLAQLLDPANRLSVRHPSGSVGPAFRVPGLLVWGFTAGVLSNLFDAAGVAEPWDRSLVEALPGAGPGDREGRGVTCFCG